ncbi:hypothetical protein DPMN_160781 [Dreissena polymorpha]|uniref:G-protein coupled receptors family 1 profile domain-containing protein n=1 Tax=Dreissena polymorpha TaxID=45954 RepID=A0A9D4EQW6_DREPO|nr:hypothetical protein DPMN_160781 [Dreissena polymorpha]
MTIVYCLFLCCAFGPFKHDEIPRNRSIKKALVTCILIITSYLICYVPFLLYQVAQAYFVIMSDEVVIAGEISDVLFVVNTFLNSFVYSLRLEQVKSFMAENMKKIRRRL